MTKDFIDGAIIALALVMLPFPFLLEAARDSSHKLWLKFLFEKDLLAYSPKTGKLVWKETQEEIGWDVPKMEGK